MQSRRHYQVKEVAEQSGVSIRALHHYDAIGLLVPSLRTAAGYRLYSADDLLRLQQILIGREIGLSLEEIRRSLDDPRALATAAYDELRAEIVTFDARRLGRSFRVPMFFFQGEQDAYSVTEAVRDYVAWIDAPRKLLAVVPGAGHSLIFAGELLLERLLADVRPVVLEAERATGGNDARP